MISVDNSSVSSYIGESCLYLITRGYGYSKFTKTAILAQL